MTEQKFIEMLTEKYGTRAVAAYEAEMQAFEEYDYPPEQQKRMNGYVHRMWEGDVTAVRDMGMDMFDMTGNPVFMLAQPRTAEPERLVSGRKDGRRWDSSITSTKSRKRF